MNPAPARPKPKPPMAIATGNFTKPDTIESVRPVTTADADSFSPVPPDGQGQSEQRAAHRISPP